MEYGPCFWKRVTDRLQMKAVGKAVRGTKRLKCWYIDGKQRLQSKKGEWIRFAADARPQHYLLHSVPWILTELPLGYSLLEQ